MGTVGKLYKQCCEEWIKFEQGNGHWKMKKSSRTCIACQACELKSYNLR